MKEIYKDIKGYEKLYQVSNIGNVKSLYKNRLLKPSIENGYLYVILYKDKQPTHKRIHRLVAEAFIDNPKNLPQVNHKDEDKLNNNVNNLEWCDNRYNVMYGTALTRAKESRSTSIKKQSKAVQCVETGIIYPSIMEAERRTKIYHGYIIHALKGRQKTAGGYHWKYVERKESDGLCPNNVRNVIKISKIKPEEIKMVLDMIATTLDDPEFPDKQYIIDFDKIIPEPRYESECPDKYKVNKSSSIERLDDRPWFNWYKWHLDNWHTKWNAYDGYTKIGKTCIMLVFSTAWTVPIPIIQRLGVLGYPINVRYADEDYGVNCGRLKYTSEQGWIHLNSLYMKDPVRFARDLWNNY